MPFFSSVYILYIIYNGVLNMNQYLAPVRHKWVSYDLSALEACK